MRYLIMIAITILFFTSCKSKKETANDPKTDLASVRDKKVANNDEIELSELQIQLGNIETDTIRNGAIGNQLVLNATLNFNQAGSSSVSSRVMGRVERLYFRNLGDYVTKGSPLYELYSDELNNAKQEYLLVLDKRKVFANETAIDFDQLLQSARNKLLLWGMSQGQIQALAKSHRASATTTFYSTASGYITALEIREGDYVMEGGTIVKLADLSSLWAEAQVYTSQLAAIDRSSVATVQLPDLDGKEIPGKIEFVNPEINPDTRINLIRVSIPNPGNLLRPGMSAYVLLKSPQLKTLTLPIDAVIRDGKGATVWIQTANKTFKTVMVQTGLETDERIEIKSGLKDGDIVVIRGAYLLNSEYIFKKGANPMEGMKM